MSRQKGRGVPAKAPEPRAHHVYPPGWRPDLWLVPFIGGGACIHHGHTHAGDHSLCGPSIFCCQQSAIRYVALFPDSSEATADWPLIAADHLQGWLRKGVQVFYFVFCDPERPEGLLAIGLGGETLPAILRRRISLERYAADADRLL